jgi:hypothetical protein
VSVSGSVTDAPGNSRFDRGSAYSERYASSIVQGNGSIVPFWRARWSGAPAHRTGTPVPGAKRHQGNRSADREPTGYAGLVPHHVIRFVLLAGLLAGLAACGSPAPSFDPTGACTTDGSAPGAYPELEARVPTTYRETAPETLDSGRNCSAENLGSLADVGFDEVRFAGATWSFGAERAVAMAVLSAPGLEAGQVAEFYATSARANSRTEILAETGLTIAGRPGRRMDTKTRERLQSVVTWPAADPGLVNVIITNDLPDGRITEAIEAFGER